MDGVSNHMCIIFIVNFFFKAVNIFESMEIAETTYEGVIEYSYKNH